MTKARVVDWLMTFAAVTGIATVGLSLVGFAVASFWPAFGLVVFNISGGAATFCTVTLLLLMGVDR